MLVLGSIFWAVMCVLAIFPNVKITLFNNVTNPIAKVIAMAVMFPILGLIFKLIGLLGDLMVTPVAHILGLG